MKSRDLRRNAFIRHHAVPTLIELDMTTAELAAFRMLRAGHPDISKLTALGWIEGQRYEPAKDPAFMAECDRALDHWRHVTGRETKQVAA